MKIKFIKIQYNLSIFFKINSNFLNRKNEKL